MKLINLVLAFSLWVARIVEIVIRWTLRAWVFLAALAASALVLLGHWVSLTISNQISGLNLSILGYLPDHPHHSLFSWGVVAAVLFLIAAVSYAFKLWRVLALTGAALLWFCLCGVLQLGLGEPALLRRLAAEEAQWTGLQQFQNAFLPTTLRQEESNTAGPPMAASIETVYDRLFAARYFMGTGWYAAIVVGLLCFFYGKARLASAQERSRLTKGALLVAGCLTVAFVSRSALAHTLVAWGQSAEAHGDPDLAIRRYRRAMQLDGWFAVHTQLDQRIGAIDAEFGRVETVEYSIYCSEMLASAGNYAEAISELEKILPRAGKRAAILREREAEMWTDYGTQLYKEHAIAAAIPAWEAALAKDPASWLAGFCLCRAYFEVGRYQESVTLTQSLIKVVRDPVLIAELDSNLGDGEMRLGKISDAHVAYRLSYLIDYVYNWRGLSGVVGAQSDVSLEDSDQSHGRNIP